MENHCYDMDICLLGNFTITYRGKTLMMNDYLSKQTVSLLEILILNYDCYVSKNVLMDLLWEHTDNPESALKFNIFRLRKLLKSIPELSQIEVIQTDKNGYRFDPKISWEVDVHTMDSIHSKLVQCSQYSLTDYHQMKKILYLYKGKLFHTSNAVWFIQHEEHYRSIYLRYVPLICEFCLSEGRYDDVRQIANSAIKLEPSTEGNYYYYIMSYVKEGEFTLAKEYYKKATEILANAYETRLSNRMKELCANLENNNSQKRNPKEIINTYRKKVFNKGAFYCSNAVFDNIYEQRLRQSVRSKEKYYLYIFEIHIASENTNITSVMKKLESSINSTLRSGDVFTKLNHLQFLVLLSCPNDESAYKIASRVSNSYRTKDKNVSNRLNYYVNLINE